MIRLAFTFNNKRKRSKFDKTATFSTILQFIETEFSIPKSNISLSTGPPTPSFISASPDQNIQTCGFLSGDLLIVTNDPSKSSMSGISENLGNNKTPETIETTFEKSSKSSTDPSIVQFSKPVTIETTTTTSETSETSETPTNSSVVSSKLTSSSSFSQTKSAPFPPKPRGIKPQGTVLRRKMPNDNECLFRACSLVLLSTRDKAREIRSIVAQHIQKDPITYNTLILGKTNPEYVKWISKPSSWGGAIELQIIAQHYKTEIAAFDIRTTSIFRFGQGPQVTERVFVLFDGIHYDSLTLSPLPASMAEEPGSEAVDLTKFSVDDGDIIQAFKEIVVDLCKQGHFTDTANFTLRCCDCDTPLVGEKEAVLHAKKTSHQNFAQYKPVK